jgi:carbon starvation protein CstA
VWLLLAPRDYLSAFVKIGVVVALAAGILIVLPPLAMPAVTQFVDGTGPVFAGPLFPFVFITIACGAISASTRSSRPAPRPSCFGARRTPGSSVTAPCSRSRWSR